MKTRFLLFSLLGLVACTQKTEIETVVSNPDVRFPLRISVARPGTRLTTAPADSVLTKLTVCVYREDGTLDAFTQQSAVDTVSIECTSLAKEVYVVSNYEFTEPVLSKTALLEKVIHLEDNTTSSFVMVGSANLNLPSVKSVQVDMNRLLSRIVLKKINRDFPSGVLATQSFKIKRIYLRNAPSDINIGRDAAPASFVNTKNYSDNSLLYDEINSSLDNKKSDPTVHYLYCCPRQAGLALRTRLVIEASLGDKNYYYPVNLPELLQPNCSYELSNLTISKPGSDNPDTAVSSETMTFTFKINPWTLKDMDDVLI